MKFIPIVVLLVAGPAAAATHDRAFWTSIAASDYAVPTGEDPFALLLEMNDLLGSTDPVLRDDVAYTAAARWIYRKRLLTAGQQRKLLTLWSGNLLAGLGERGTDSVFRRSFSALTLSVLAALDLEAPFLTQGEYDALLARALEYLSREEDKRGYEAGKGWAHSAAHTADLLKFLARSPKLPRAAQPRILDAVAEACAANGQTFAWGEDERLGQILRSLARRTDVDLAGFDAWLSAFPTANKELWAKGPAIDAAAFPPVQNAKLVLRAAYVSLAADEGLTGASLQARRHLLQTLSEM